jgi:hypothetical protein
VLGFERAAPSLPAGRVERRGSALRLHCRDGIVELA